MSAEPTWRAAAADDAVALRDLERVASQAGLHHVFGDLPYPDDTVLARWRELLADPGVRVEVVDGPRPGALTALVAHDGTALRHLAVAPDGWGAGLGRAGVGRARAAGARRLWVLEANTRARGLYEQLGWTPSGTTQDCPYPPHPLEVEYVVGDGPHLSRGA